MVNTGPEVLISLFERSNTVRLRSYQHGRTETHVFPSVRGRGCVHKNTDGPGRTEKNGAYKETEADVVVVVETKGEQGALYPQIFCASC